MSTNANNAPVTRTPNDATVQLTGRHAVEAFTTIVQDLYEKDYGDFMRKVGLYLERLRTDLGGRSTEAAKILMKMKTYTVYSPDFDIESTRLKLLRDADDIRRLV